VDADAVLRWRHAPAATSATRRPEIPAGSRAGAARFSRLHAPEAFDDGRPLWAAVCEHELEGVVAERRSVCYVPGERGWVKVKDRGYGRYELKRQSALRRRAGRRPVAI